MADNDGALPNHPLVRITLGQMYRRCLKNWTTRRGAEAVLLYSDLQGTDYQAKPISMANRPVVPSPR